MWPSLAPGATWTSADSNGSRVIRLLPMACDQADQLEARTTDDLIIALRAVRAASRFLLHVGQP